MIEIGLNGKTLDRMKIELVVKELQDNGFVVGLTNSIVDVDFNYKHVEMNIKRNGFSFPLIISVFVNNYFFRQTRIKFDCCENYVTFDINKVLEFYETHPKLKFRGKIKRNKND